MEKKIEDYLTNKKVMVFSDQQDKEIAANKADELMPHFNGLTINQMEITLESLKARLKLSCSITLQYYQGE